MAVPTNPTPHDTDVTPATPTAQKTPIAQDTTTTTTITTTASRLPRLYVYGPPHTIEEVHIYRVAREAGTELIDLRDAIRSTDDVIGQLNQLLPAGTNYFLSSVPFQDLLGLSNPYEVLCREDRSICILRESGVPGGMSALAQVCALLSHELTLYEQRICTFATRHIWGLHRDDVPTELIQRIALEDRLARGGTMHHESYAATRATNNMTWYHKPALILEWQEDPANHKFQNDPDEEFEQRALIDSILLRTSESNIVTLIFSDLGHDRKVFRAHVYTNSQSEITAFRRFAKRHGYSISDPWPDEATKLKGFYLMARNPAKQVRSVKPYVVRYRRPKY